MQVDKKNIAGMPVAKVGGFHLGRDSKEKNTGSNMN